MRLTTEQIKAFILEPKNGSKIIEARNLQRDAEIHFTGIGYENLITQLIGKESARDYANKKELGEPITKPIAETLYNNLTMFFSRGSSVRYHEFGESATYKSEFEQTLSKIYNNDSLQNFTKNWFSKALCYRFNDFVVITRPAIKGNMVIINGIEQQEKESPKRYIITVGITKVRDYLKNGDKVEYLIYEYDRKDNKIIYRVLDETSDSLWQQVGKEVTPVINDFGKEDRITHDEIPVRQVGTILNDINDPNVCKSIVDSSIPLLRRYVKFDAINILTEVNSSYSLPWSIGGSCTKCGGEGTLMENNERVECPVCKGSGFEGRHRPGEMMIIPYKIMESERPLTGQPAGIIEGSIDTPKFQAERQQQRLEYIYQHALGTQPYSQLQKTATEVDVNIKPLEDRNARVAEMCEEFEKWVCRIVGSDYSVYKGSSIVYNKKLNLRNEASIIKEIKEAKDNGAPQSYIRSLVEEMIYARYSNDKLELERQLLLLQLEPLVGYTIEEVMKMPQVDDNTKYIKQNIQKLIREIEIKYNMNFDKIELEKLTELLNKEAKENIGENKIRLAEVIGVGGTQSLQNILSDQFLTIEQKKGILKVLFNLSDDEINLIFAKQTINNNNL